MGRKLYYIDSYGHAHRDRKAEKAQRSGGFDLGKRVIWAVVIVLAVLVVLSSLH